MTEFVLANRNRLSPARLTQWSEAVDFDIELDSQLLIQALQEFAAHTMYRRDAFDILWEIINASVNRAHVELGGRGDFLEVCRGVNLSLEDQIVRVILLNPSAATAWIQRLVAFAEAFLNELEMQGRIKSRLSFEPRIVGPEPGEIPSAPSPVLSESRHPYARRQRTKSVQPKTYVPPSFGYPDRPNLDHSSVLQPAAETVDIYI